jgi:hypothetical protein
MPRFFPTEAVRHLTRGSFERLIAKLEEALQDYPLFEGASSYVLGTFSGHAIVASDEGACARVKYEDLGDTIEVLEHELVELKSYDTSEVSEFLEDESRKVLDLWTRGRLTEATERLRSLVEVSDKVEPVSESDLMQSWLQTLTQDRPWTTLLDEKRGEIEGALAETTRIGLHRKFHRLYDGSTSKKDLEPYRGLVTSDLGDLKESLTTLIRNTQNASETASAQAARFEAGNAVSALVAFSEDLLEDLARIDRIASEATKHVSDVANLSQLHDLIEARLTDAQIATDFVDTLAKSLSTHPISGEQP